MKTTLTVHLNFTNSCFYKLQSYFYNLKLNSRQECLISKSNTSSYWKGTSINFQFFFEKDQHLNLFDRAISNIEQENIQDKTLKQKKVQKKLECERPDQDTLGHYNIRTYNNRI